ncbi:hypothetical protein GU243_19155 [Pseudarthrobacter psychrotolerans]|uniref:Uncharacterized protein n=1 Tax=Pseudarthrobacter psychrotolerans TaxID=2697569 RepID=A0A6P1NM51_9MICC|nr:hypothetical protein [Pseudarthrobacter psychrotolerans]QHK21466.1 hypothetical protein GU243_19155 [Pseudarthrobacter psychrotolerans]
MADGKDPAADEPLYEPIGAGKIQDDDEIYAGDATSPGGVQVRLLVISALATALLTVRSGRFWWESAAILGLCWGAGTLLVIAVVAGGDLPPESHAWVYVLTAAMLVLVSCVLAVRWGAVRPGAAPDPADAGVAGPLLGWVRCGAKGLIFASVAVVFLLLLSFWSESSPAVAGVSFALMILEVMVFGGIGAGAARWFEGQGGTVLAWSVAALLLVGNVVAVIALLPSVRAYEPVVVAINIQRDEFGRVISYRCSPEFRGIAEVYHTERIFWMATSNPMVILALIAGEAEPKENALDWLPGELQNAAEGTQVPCVEGQEREKTGAEMPPALIGIGTQSGAAGILLAGGHRAARRRLNPAA